MVYRPRKELLWQFREENCIRCWIHYSKGSEFCQWIEEQAAYHYPPELWRVKDHILPIAGSNHRKYPGRVPIDVYCPDNAFKALVKLAWG